jgi:DNA-binding CsgD family transcriptional regulator
MVPRDTRLRPTPRQLDVLRLMVEGHTTKRASVIMGISHHAAYKHVADAVARTGCRHRFDLATLCLREGWL